MYPVPSFYQYGDAENGHSESATLRMAYHIVWLASLRHLTPS